MPLSLLPFKIKPGLGGKEQKKINKQQQQQKTEFSKCDMAIE